MKRKKPVVSVVDWIVLISIFSLLALVIFYPAPPITVVLRRENGTSYMVIKSENEEFFKQLQHKGQSYYKGKDYLYTYGSTGFVYVNLHNGDVYVVLKKDLDQDNIDFLTSYLTMNRRKINEYFPKITLINENQLDEETYMIMKKLENEIIPYPHYDPIPIYNK